MINLEKEIQKSLRLYEKEIAEAIYKSANKVSNKAVRRLKAESPNNTGDYARGWRRTKDGKGFIVYNKTDYQLTHLLEKEHDIVSWGVNRGTYNPAKTKHIEKIEKDAIETFEKMIEDAIKQ